MSPLKTLPALVAVAVAIGFPHASSAQDFAMSLAMPDPAAPAAPQNVAQASPSRTSPGNAAQADAAKDATGASSTTSSMSAGRGGASKLSSSDRSFLEKAAKGGAAEVELGKLAQQRAASEQVKQFGSRMVEDHGKANDQLKRLAEAKGVTLTDRPDGGEARTVKRLQALSGAEFDRAYMKEMLADHKKDVGEFTTKAKSARDADVKDFAQSTLPTLQQHLELAKSVDATTRAASRTANPRATRGPGLPPPPSTGV